MPGQMIHSSLAFCREDYYSKIQLPPVRTGLVPVPENAVESESEPFLLRSASEISQRIGRRFDLQSSRIGIEMDIFDNSKVPETLHKLKSSSGAERNLWAYRLTMSTTSGSFVHLLTFLASNDACSE
jgi:hypothetical protein